MLTYFLIFIISTNALRVYDAIPGMIIENNLKSMYKESGPYVKEKICDDEECYVIYDIFGFIGYEPCFIRVFGLDFSFNLGYSVALLETPKVFNQQFYNTSLWMPNKAKIDYDTYPPAICDAFFWSGAIPRYSLNKTYDIVIVGLGGGDFSNFYDVTYPHLNISVVEISETVTQIAKKWFNVTESDRYRIIVEDGVSFFEQQLQEGKKYDGILLDATYSSMNARYVSPVAEFLDPITIQMLANVIHQEGVLVSNVVIGSFETNPTLAKIQICELFQKFFEYVDLIEVSPFNSVLIARHLPFQHNPKPELFHKHIPFQFLQL